ncbi:hypothetical protein BBJ28_00013337 [Nothophytophthora sp. Chile5]|nr:hypothetical protein BBJ28_00013337 [Nothophytophthora sp. Chile5]
MSAFFPVISALNPAAVPKMAAAPAARPSVLATSAAKWDARLSHEPVHDNAFYGKCMLGGILSCGITHTAMTPLDVVKCNMQVNPAKFTGLVPGIKTIASEEGVGAIFKGWAPTAIGYSMQGMCKFGFYDIFKDMYSTMAGEENAFKYRGAIYLAGSASAEFFADMLLCPMEMVKVKVQTSPAGTFPVKLGPAVAAMRANSAETRFPFGSLVPLWSRQIPYTMAKFFFFEKVVEAFYTHVFTEPKSSYPKSTQLGVTFASGYLAGIICAIVSHPADSVVSLMGKPANKGKGFGQIVNETGMMALATKGLGTRIIMIGTLTGAQWWIYDTFKTAMGMGTSGGPQTASPHFPAALPSFAIHPSTSQPSDRPTTMSAFFPVISTLNPIAKPQMAAPSARPASILATSAAKWDARLSHDPIHDNAYYGKCMIAGILSCGVTHTGITPLDVVKCNMQVNPAKFKGLLPGIKTIASEEGSAALFKGWAPTAIGYSMQGMCKFGFYEFFKDMYSTMAGEENAFKYRGAIYLAGSASAEFFADIALCPMEMVKVKVQTSPAGTFPVEFGPAVAAMRANSAETRFPFGSLVPLWSRQIPYTMAKFFFFEKVVEAFYTHVFTEPKSSYPKSTQLGVTFASGYLAGVICAIVSHPADSVVSLMGKAENKGKGFGQIASETGLVNLATKGLGTRIIMIGTLTGAQWWIYDTFKTVMGMGTSGGAAKKH